MQNFRAKLTWKIHIKNKLFLPKLAQHAFRFR